MSTFREGFEGTRTRARLLQTLLSHSRGLEVTGQNPRNSGPQAVGQIALSPEVLTAEVESGAPASQRVQANIANLS